MASLNILGIGDEDREPPGAGVLQIRQPDPAVTDQGQALAQLYTNVTDEIRRQRAISAERGLWDEQTGLPTAKGLLDIGRQYGDTMLLGSTSPRVFHGTAVPGMTFEPGRPAFFTTDPARASFYAETGSRQFVGDPKQPNVIPAYLDIKNPKVIEGLGPGEQEAAFKAAQAAGHDGIILRAPGVPDTYVAFNPSQILPGIGTAPKAAFDWTPGGGSKTAQIGKTELTYGIDRTGETGEVILVKTPPAERGQGEARRAMEQLTEHADTQGTTLFLNADPMGKGVTKGGLDRFYRSLGFVKNVRRNKDFRSTAEYVRQPTKPEEPQQ